MKSILFCFILFFFQQKLFAQIATNVDRLASVGEFEIIFNDGERAVFLIEHIDSSIDRYCNKEPCIISGDVVFGVDNIIPMITKLSYMRLIRDNGEIISLDVSNMYNVSFYYPHQVSHPNKYGSFLVKSCLNEDYCVYRGSYTSFVAEWTVIDGRAIRTVLSNRNDIIRIFDVSELEGIRPFPE